MGGALVPPAVSESKSKTATNNTGLLGVHLAYDWFVESFYASFETAYRFSPGSADSTLMLEKAGNVVVFDDENFRVSQYHNHDISFNLHLGHTVTDCFLLYGIIGLRVGFFEQKIKVRANTLTGLVDNNKRRDTKIGGAFGLGGRFGLPHGWSISTEATYDVYGKIKSSKNLHIEQAGTEGTAFTQSSSRPHMLNLVLKVSKTL